jgi:hypothetical protein
LPHQVGVYVVQLLNIETNSSTLIFLISPVPFYR